MKRLHAVARVDEPVTEFELEQALERGRGRAAQAVRADSVSYLPAQRVLAIRFADGSGLLLPVASYPEFAGLTESELHQLTVGFAGSALCLPARDLHVSIAGMAAASEHLLRLAPRVLAAGNRRLS